MSHSPGGRDIPQKEAGICFLEPERSARERGEVGNTREKAERGGEHI